MCWHGDLALAQHVKLNDSLVVLLAWGEEWAGADVDGLVLAHRFLTDVAL